MPKSNVRTVAPWLSPRARPGRCGWCGQWLGAPLAETVNSEHTATSGGLRFEEQCIRATLVGEFLAAPPQVGATVLSTQVRDAVNFAAERLCAGNGAALGRLLGVPKNTVWDWRGTGAPSISAPAASGSPAQCVVAPSPSESCAFGTRDGSAHEPW